MDNTSRWNITNSAHNIVSALVDPSKQYDNVFRREWNNTFSGFTNYKLFGKSKIDADLKLRLDEYLNKLEARKKAIACSRGHAIKSSIQDSTSDIVNIVPKIYLEKDFELSSLDTFNTVIQIDCETSNGQISDLDDGDILNSFVKREPYILTKDQLKRLQQNLTDYLDIIEDQLSSQISNRSGDFFQVMSSVDSVMDELSRVIKSVTNLRRRCSRLNDSIMIPNMKSIQINRTRCNAQSVLDKLNDIAYLCRVQPMIQILLSASDFVGALDLIAKSRVMLHKDLSRVVSLRYMESQLNEIERMIGTMMQQEFLTLISSEWDGSFNQQTSAASRLSKLFEYFANGYAEIPDRGSLTLLSLLQIQAEKFVNQFHEERKKRIESALEVELWKVVEVPSSFQLLITMLIDDEIKISDIFTGDNLQLLTQTDCAIQNQTDNQSLRVFQNDYHNGSTNDPSSSRFANNLSIQSTSIRNTKTEPRQDPVRCRYVRAANCTFVIVNSVISIIRTIMDYCKCAHDIRSLSADLLERLFKILLFYNSKTYHLVYSAGAIQTAGLKSITTRILIVSQRSLKLINLVIPVIQSHFTLLLPNDKRLRRFDEIKALYNEHVEKIPERVNSTVADIINLQLQEWEAKPPVPSPQFSSVAQHLMRLHDNIQDILPKHEMQSLFIKIHETFKVVLISHLRRLNIHNDAGPQQWLVMQELTFYKISLNKLDFFNDLDINFDDLWTRLNFSNET